MDLILTHPAIDERKSTRTFRNEPLTPADLASITAYITSTENLIGPFGNRCRFELVIEDAGNDKTKIGTYGFIANAQGYILGGSTKN